MSFRKALDIDSLAPISQALCFSQHPMTRYEASEGSYATCPWMVARALGCSSSDGKDQAALAAEQAADAPERVWEQLCECCLMCVS